MNAGEVVDRFRAEMSEEPNLAPLVMVAEPLLSQSPAAVVGTLDAIVIRYCRARGAALSLPEVTA